MVKSTRPKTKPAAKTKSPAKPKAPTKPKAPVKGKPPAKPKTPTKPKAVVEAAVKYMTPKELGITPKEHSALIVVMDGLKDGTLVHSHSDDNYERSPPKKPLFNMESVHCGSACCIGGWVGVLTHGKEITTDVKIINGFPDLYWNSESSRKTCLGLEELYNPFSATDNHLYGLAGDLHEAIEDVSTNFSEYTDIKPKQAAMAIHNFLTTGWPDWMGVLASAKDKKIFQKKLKDLFDNNPEIKLLKIYGVL